MENTLENKAKFFAQYFGQQVRAWKSRGYVTDFLYHVDIGSFANDVVEYSNLQLKPLSAISDEDAIELAKIWGVPLTDENIPIWIEADGITRVKDSIKGEVLTQYTTDYLRSKGYLVPFNGLSCEEILNRGWTVLGQ